MKYSWRDLLDLRRDTKFRRALRLCPKKTSKRLFLKRALPKMIAERKKLQFTNRLTLYAVMVECYNGTSWGIEGIRYVQAPDLHQAKVVFALANRFSGRRIGLDGNGIAPALGFTIADKEGKVLVA
jgi:hypothetical protein